MAEKAKKKEWKKSPVNLLMIVVGIIIVVVIVLLLVTFNDPMHKARRMDQAELDAQCQTIDYEAYKADPAGYKGEYIKLRVQVYQKVNDSLFNVYTAADGETDSDSWMGGHYLLNDDRRPQEPTLEEGMIVTVYGVCAGKQKMTAANENGDDGLPAVDIVYIDFEGYEPIEETVGEAGVEGMTDGDGMVGTDEMSGADGTGGTAESTDFNDVGTVEQ